MQLNPNRAVLISYRSHNHESKKCYKVIPLRMLDDNKTMEVYVKKEKIVHLKGTDGTQITFGMWRKKHLLLSRIVFTYV